MEELESGQLKMQEKIAQMTKMATNLTREKGITDDPDLQRKSTSWKGGIDPSIEPNLDDCCEQGRLRKDPFGRSHHVDMQQRCSLLDKKLKKIKGVDDLGSVDPREISLVPDVVIPPKFKMSKFEKYDGTKCLENHLATYCNKMVGHARNEDLLIYVFYESLTGVAAQWYTKLKKDQIRTLRDLAPVFLERYKYMLEASPDRLTLQNMKKGPDEDYKEYAIRWKNVASIVRPPLTSREENSMFMDTLPFPYYDMLIVNTFVEFGDLIYSVGRIEDGIKKGRIVDTRASKEERKKFVLDEHVQAMSGKKKRSHETSKKPVKSRPRSLRVTPHTDSELQDFYHSRKA